MSTGAGPARLPLDMRTRRGAPGRDAALVEAMLDALPSPTVLLAPDGTIAMANSGWLQAGEEHSSVIPIGADYYEAAPALNDDVDARTLVQQLRELACGERSKVALDRSMPTPADGTMRWYHVQASRVDQAGHVVVTHTDVTARVLAERASAWQARHDHLTELPNRVHLHELIDAELQRAHRAPVAVLFLDVDGFKDVNDSLGHEVGDQLLRQLAGRLLGASRTQDAVGRLGGDEFVIVCRDCDTDGAETLAARCQAAFDDPFELGNRTVRLSASIGIAGAGPRDRRTTRATDLVRDADLAMYAAKSAGRNRVRVFSPDLRESVQQRVQLAAELRTAIDAGQLTLHYQPIMHVPTRRCTGVEALVRWQHPERGLVAPDDFLPIAEEHDLVAPLARWVLGEATRQTAAWSAAGLHLVTGVNISASHFITGTLVEDVCHALREAGLPPEQLVIELTETTVAEDPEQAAAQCAALRSTGIEVSIDDFGRGFSSLGQLVSIPAGILKIDRSLVAFTEGRKATAAAAIAAVVALGRACGIRSLAEGVESAEQLELAAELGCTYAQGYHIARPMPAVELPRWMVEHSCAAPLTAAS